jgi:hypothetical protein
VTFQKQLLNPFVPQKKQGHVSGTGHVPAMFHMKQSSRLDGTRLKRERLLLKDDAEDLRELFSWKFGLGKDEE